LLKNKFIKESPYYYIHLLRFRQMYTAAIAIRIYHIIYR